MEHIVYVGIGSNIDDKLDQCRKAIDEILKTDHHKLLSTSSFYRTRPFGYAAQDWFVNAVIKFETDLSPLDLLQSLKDIELLMGRTQTIRWGPRTIDLDLLLYDEEVIQWENLQIPHPRLHERQFVLIPLAEIDPALIHPVLKKPVRELLDQIQEEQGVEKLQLPD